MITRYQLDLATPAQFSPEQQAHHAILSDAAIEKGALEDAENPPLTPEELARMTSVQLVRRARASTKLSQTQFAKQFCVNLARLRDLEQGRTTADSALAAYLTVIMREPHAVLRALDAA